jgi:hypothetical protein
MVLVVLAVYRKIMDAIKTDVCSLLITHVSRWHGCEAHNPGIA